MDVQEVSATGYYAMHKLGQCSWPIWRVDDFTNCFQREYVYVAKASMMSMARR